MTRTTIARSVTDERRFELAGITAAHDRRLRLVSEQLVPGSFRSPAADRQRRRPSRLTVVVQGWLAGGQL